MVYFFILYRTQKIYEYQFEASYLDKFIITPRVVERSSLLFYPPSHKFSADQFGPASTCPNLAPSFAGRLGVFLQGLVIPAVANIQIVVDGSVLGKKLFTAVTNSSGSYSFGPLEDTQTYWVNAVSNEYLVEPVGVSSAVSSLGEKLFLSNFVLRKLGEIVVTVLEGNGDPVSEVLVSLSGLKLRQNNATNADGNFSFVGLFAGSYHVRPILKEFKFSPSGLEVVLEEGQTKAIEFTAERYAYSAFGHVSNLVGEAEKGVVILAHTDDHSEETVTDASGAFRLRGLLPGKTYHISVKAGLFKFFIEIFF